MTQLFGVYRTLNAPGWNVKDFGAKGDGTTDDIAAFEAAIDAMNVPGASIYSRGRELIIPYGTYRLSRALHITWSMLIHGAGFGEAAAASHLLFDSGVHGVIFDSVQSSITNRYAAWSEMRNVYVSAAGKGVANKHGIILRVRAKIENTIVGGFSGNGIHVVSGDGNNVDGNTQWTTNTAYTDGDWVTNGGSGARFVCIHSGISASSGAGPTGTSASIADGSCIWKSPASTGSAANYMGNANNVFLGYCRVTDNGGHGVYFEGDDTNAGTTIGIDASSNGGSGLYDKSFLGNSHYGAHAATNGGAPYRTATHGNCYAMFNNCYSESDQTGSDIRIPAIVQGGLHAAGFLTTSDAFTQIGRSMSTHYVANAQSGKTLTATVGRSSVAGGIFSALEATHTDDAAGVQFGAWESSWTGWGIKLTNYDANITLLGADERGRVRLHRPVIRAGYGSAGSPRSDAGAGISATNGHPLVVNLASNAFWPGDLVLNQNIGNDSIKGWVANAKCGSGPAWTASTSGFKEGATVTPTTPNGKVYRRHSTSTSYTTGSSEPTWPTTLGQLTASDNGIIWECFGVTATSAMTAL